jgi:2-amino-4-hydroxy-6-hydroxymethyldihydropteridine diphosphokinase
VKSRYLIALGSNRRHHRHGRPAAVLAAALIKLGKAGLKLERAGPVAQSAPLGPSRRRYANSAALVSGKLEPDELLRVLKRIERQFGRRAGGQRWGSRVLDLDIVLWSGGAWSGPGLVIPHIHFRERDFVLDPAAAIAPDWRDPLTGLSLRQLAFRLGRPRRLRSAARQ